MKFLFVLSSSTNTSYHFKRFLPKTFTPHRARQTHQKNSHWCSTGTTGGFWNWLCSTKPNPDNQIMTQFLNKFRGWLLFALPIQVDISQRISDLASIQKINYPKPFLRFFNQEAVQVPCPNATSIALSPQLHSCSSATRKARCTVFSA